MRRRARARQSARGRLLAWVFIGYLAVVAFGVFGPAPGDQIEQAGDGVRRAADGIADPAPGRPAGGAEGTELEVPVLGRLTNEGVANAAMFVPRGVLFPVVVARWRWWTVPAGVALSGVIELIQLLFLSCGARRAWTTSAGTAPARSSGSCCGRRPGSGGGGARLVWDEGDDQPSRLGGEW